MSESTSAAGGRNGVATSSDGTDIAWTVQGSGPALVMVHCVATSRATTPQPTLAAALAEHFTVWSYDRRGTGESAAGPKDYRVEQEFEDLAAILGLADGPVTVYGFSSGATFSLLAAQHGLPIERLVLLEPPLFPEPDPEFHLRGEAERQLGVGLAEARRWFDTQVVGVPAEVLDQMPPANPEMLENTRTITHELTFLPGTSAQGFADVQQPTLLLASDKTAPMMLEFCSELDKALPNATYRVLPGEWHGVDDATLVKAITEELAGS